MICCICKGKALEPHWHVWDGKRWCLCQTCAEQRAKTVKMLDAVKGAPYNVK
jgi:hypothetical protein